MRSAARDLATLHRENDLAMSPPPVSESHDEIGYPRHLWAHRCECGEPFIVRRDLEAHEAACRGLDALVETWAEMAERGAA